MWFHFPQNSFFCGVMSSVPSVHSILPLRLVLEVLLKVPLPTS